MRTALLSALTSLLLLSGVTSTQATPTAAAQPASSVAQPTSGTPTAPSPPAAHAGHEAHAARPTPAPLPDVDIEFQVDSKFAAQSQALAWALEDANEKYATDYPAAVGRHMTNTDSHEFQDAVASISVRENERGAQVGNGWDPQWHQPTDLYATYNDDDFRLGLNAAQTTLSAVARLAGAAVRK